MMVERALVPNVCISGVSVACATATTNPIDVVKVRMQALNTTNAKNAKQHVANVSLGLSRARRGRFLRRVDAVSAASDDVRRVKVRVVRPDSEESRIQFGILRGGG